MTRVLGVVMSRDDWPSVGLAIVNALTKVDVVLVIDHGSVDDTPAGLAALSVHFGDRLEVMRIDDTPYWQEAITNLAIARRGVDDVDWVHVFDADEFLLLPEHTRLADVLDRAPADCHAVRYDVQNFVVPFDFRRSDIGHYERIEHRSLPCNVVGATNQVYADEITRGNLNYFDLHFQSKVIVRTAGLPWIIAGTHDATNQLERSEHSLDPQDVRVAHVPLGGFESLAGRVAHGRLLREQGFSPDHGWQSQMLARMADEGALDRFWSAHSVGAPADAAVDAKPPTVEIDLALSTACRAAAVTLLDALDHAPFGAPTSESVHSVPLLPAISALHAAQRARAEASTLVITRDDQLAEVRTALAGTRQRIDDLEVRNDHQRQRIDAAEATHLEMVGQLDGLRHEHDATIADRDTLHRSLDEANAHRADLERELDAMRATVVWRWSAPLRRLRARLRQ